MRRCVRHRNATVAVAAIVIAIHLASSPARAATDPTVKCQSAKLRATAKAARSLLDCHADATSAQTPIASPCVDAARQKLARAFTDSDATGGCAITGDGAAVWNGVEAFAVQARDSTGEGASTACVISRLGATGRYAQRLLAAEQRYKKRRDVRRLVVARATAATTFASALERGACVGATAELLAAAAESFVAAVRDGLFCGDRVRDLAETCDGGDDTLCPGGCLADCRCPPRPTTSTCLARGGPVVTVAATETEVEYDAPTPDMTVDARAATLVGSPATPYPLRLDGSAGVCIVGATVAGQYDRDLGWDAMHDLNNAAVYVENDRSIVEGARIDDVGDGIRPVGGPFTVRGAWLSYIRDDCIENDHVRGGVVEDSLLDGCYTAVSERPSPAIIDSGADGRGDTLLIRGSLIRLQPMPGPHNGAASDQGHGGFFKWDDLATQLSLHDNVFLAEQAAESGAGTMNVPPLVSCSDNVMVWLGPGAYPEPLPPCFTVTTSRAVWDDAVAAWKQRWAHSGG